MSNTKIVLDGYFTVSKCAKDETYGVQATIVEIGEMYPQSFNLNLPNGHMWERGEQMHLVANCTPVTITAKQGGVKFFKFQVTDYKKSKVTIDIREEKK